MQEWLSYSLSDLLLFSEQTYLRQFELYSQWLFPLQWIFYLYTLLSLFAILSARLLLIRLLFMMVALLWLICAYGYLWQYYAGINWLAQYFIVIFVLQALLIFYFARFKILDTGLQLSGYRLKLAIILWIFAVTGQPALHYLSDSNGVQLTLFAVTPDSLASISMAFMLVLRLPVYFFIPTVLWLLFSVLTYLAMDSLSILFPLLVLLCYFLLSLSTLMNARRNA